MFLEGAVQRVLYARFVHHASIFSLKDARFGWTLPAGMQDDVYPCGHKLS